MSRDLPVVLGQAAALGLNPSAILRADPVEAPILIAAIEHAAEFARKRDENLAVLIVNTLAQAMKKKR